MSFEHHHNQQQQQPQRQLEMRDSSILDRMASSKRSRGQLASIANNQHHNKMTPWGTDVLQTIDDNDNQDAATSSKILFSSQQEHPHGKGHSNLPHDQMTDADAGSYHCPDVTKTHNHFQNNESEFRARKLQMTSSRINESHFSAGVVVPEDNNNNNASNEDAAAAVAPGNNNNDNDNDNENNNTSLFSSTTRGQQQQQQQQPVSPPPEHRKMLHSKINDGHGIFFTAPGSIQQQQARPGTPRVARDYCYFPTGTQPQQQQQNNNNDSTTSNNSNSNNSSVHEPFQQRYSRGPVKNPWNGYTDSKEKFGGRVDKTGFW